MRMQEHRLAAIMFTDIVGYSALMGKDEDRAFEILAINREIHNTYLLRHNGTLIKELGDGILASFSSNSDAVRCAIEIQQEAKAENIQLRIGIHEGEVVFEGGDVLGDGVNVALRLEEMAEEGCIIVSGAVYRDIKNKTAIYTEFVEEKVLKNIDEPIRMYRVHCEQEEPAINIKPQVTSKYKLPYYIITSLLVLIFAVVLIWILYSRQQIIAKETEVEKSIAILPFKNLSPELENQYFCDGIMEGILNHLSNIEDLRVASRASTEQYRENVPTAKQMAEELKVSHLLYASVFKSEGKIRVTAQLIDATKDEHLWSKQYDRELKDVFEVMSDISQKVASEIEVVIAPDIKKRLEVIPTENLEAYELYLKGKEYYFKGGEYNLNTALHFYQQAIEHDPDFALVYVWQGITYHDQTYWSDYLKETFGDTLIYFADRALSINPELADGYWLRGVYYQQKGDYDNSIINLKKAIDLNPNHGDSYRFLGRDYYWKGEFKDAIINLKKAKKIKTGDPNYPDLLFRLGWIYLFINDYKRAEIEITELLNYRPSFGYEMLIWLAISLDKWDKVKIYVDNICAIDSGEYCLGGLSRWYEHQGDFTQALKYFELVRKKQIEKGYPVKNVQHRYGYLLYKLDRKNEAIEYFNNQIEYCKESIRLNRPYANDEGAYYNLAGTYAFLGEKEKAYQSIHDLENKKLLGWLVRYTKVDPLFENLRKDEEFKQIIRRYEKKSAELRAELDRLEKEGLL